MFTWMVFVMILQTLKVTALSHKEWFIAAKSYSKNWFCVGCYYDGGDCCLSKVNTRDCTECICKQDMQKQISYEDLGCDQELLADGFCDDDMNNMMCNYDGGDCCAHVVPSPLYFGLTEWVY